MLLFPRTQSGLEVVGHFSYPHEADLARTRLESVGIDAWVLDDHQVRMQWHMGAALGGVKLAVDPDDAPRARVVLAEDRSHLLDDIPEQALPAHADERCPRCASPSGTAVRTHVQASPLRWLQSILFFGFFDILVARRRTRSDWQCGSCDHRWSS
jgi:hypothetical protein